MRDIIGYLHIDVNYPVGSKNVGKKRGDNFKKRVFDQTRSNEILYIAGGVAL